MHATPQSAELSGARPLTGRESGPVPWLLYPITLLLELPAVWVRSFLLIPPVLMILAFTGQDIHQATRCAGWIALFPLAWSLLALVYPLGSAWLWRNQLGGRAPSPREHEYYTYAISQLIEADPDLRVPDHWFVVDDPALGAAVLGRCLMVTRGLTESLYLTAVLAHELGHYQSLDGRLTSALNRLCLLQPRRRAGQPIHDYHPAALTGMALGTVIRWLFVLGAGGISLILTRPLWSAWWRYREYAADHHAAHLGQSQVLAEFLEVHGLDYDMPIPFVWLSEHAHPPTELRIARLRAYAEPPNVLE